MRLTGDYSEAYRCRCRCYYGIRSLTAASCHNCWVRRFVDGMSSSERCGGFRCWFVIHSCCSWSVINWWFTAWLLTSCASHTDGYPCLAISYIAIRRPFRYGASIYEWALSVQAKSANLSELVWAFNGCELRVWWSVELDRVQRYIAFNWSGSAFQIRDLYIAFGSIGSAYFFLRAFLVWLTLDSRTKVTSAGELMRRCFYARTGQR